MYFLQYKYKGLVIDVLLSEWLRVKQKNLAIGEIL